MDGKLFIDSYGDICIDGLENNLVACAARDDCSGQYRPLNPDVVQEIVHRWNAHDDLVAEIARLRADRANAGAVMVEACAQAAHDRTPGKHMGGTLAAHCTGKSIEDAIRDLSTLSPIAAAARVLMPVFEEKHRAHMTAKGRNPADYSSSYSMMVQDLRALAEQEKAE